MGGAKRRLSGDAETEGQPQERQHSDAVRRDAGPTAPGGAFNISPQGPSPEAEARIEKRSARSDKSGI